MLNTFRNDDRSTELREAEADRARLSTGNPSCTLGAASLYLTLQGVCLECVWVCVECEYVCVCVHVCISVCAFV